MPNTGKRTIYKEIRMIFGGGRGRGGAGVKFENKLWFEHAPKLVQTKNKVKIAQNQQV